MPVSDIYSLNWQIFDDNQATTVAGDAIEPENVKAVIAKILPVKARFNLVDVNNGSTSSGYLDFYYSINEIDWYAIPTAVDASAALTFTDGTPSSSGGLYNQSEKLLTGTTNSYVGFEEDDDADHNGPIPRFNETHEYELILMFGTSAVVGTTYHIKPAINTGNYLGLYTGKTNIAIEVESGDSVVPQITHHRRMLEG